VGVVVVTGVLVFIAKAWYDSRLPGTYNVMDFGSPDYGGGEVPATGGHGSGHEGHARATSVADLHGPPLGSPDSEFTLTAEQATVHLASGRSVEALTFDGKSPGPELRVRQGDLVQVTLVNKDVDGGVTIHWHGVDVPNAEDGVAGVTQNAVLPGERSVYRFRVEQVGTFWYHTHQVSSKEVRRGLFGAFVIEPAHAAPSDVLDDVVISHSFDGFPTLDGNDGLEQRAVAPGASIRLRLVNSDSTPQRFTLGGTTFRVISIDGTDLNEPPPIENETLEIGAGGRVDLEFAMPNSPVRLSIVDTDVGLALSPDGKARPPAAVPGPDFDPATYGQPAPTPFDSSAKFDRHFELSIGRKPGFYDGHPGLQWSINGGIYPHLPVFVVEKGDLVSMTVTNDTKAVHPMHLHGHHVLVLSRDGKATSGSPWWVDTLNVKAGETYEVAFRADNPGLWMDHCHNLRHAADGLTTHLVYVGVATPFSIGDADGNAPE
jgi:FtsP/CotA-like multicopper oxidase with cupredoxin domain